MRPSAISPLPHVLNSRETVIFGEALRAGLPRRLSGGAWKVREIMGFASCIFK